MRIIKVWLFFTLCAGLAGFLSVLPVLSVEKLRFGSVRIELLDKEQWQEDQEALKDATVNARDPKKPRKVVAEKRRPGGPTPIWARKVIIQRHPHESYVSLKDISFDVIHAVIVSEDMKFYLHQGVDYEQIEDALDDFRRGRPLRGASTITQQLVKNVFLTHERSLTRKLREYFIALYLDYRLPKSKIMELYLNAIEFGPNIWGIKAASQYYFKKHPKDLSAKEGAFLAMLLPSPVRYSASFQRRSLSQYARVTINQILFKMKLTGFLSGQKYFQALTSPLPFEARTAISPEI